MNKLTNWKKIGYIGVDAGLCWVGDPCYILHKEKLPETLGKDWSDFCTKLGDDVTKFNYELGHEGLGVCVSTGYGDGLYPVYANIEKGLVRGIWVDFCGPDSE